MTMKVSLVFLLAMVAIASSSSLVERIKETMNQRHQVSITIPSNRTVSVKGVWNQINQGIRNRQHFTIRIPAIPFISNLWKRNATTDTSTKQPDSSSSVDASLIALPSSSSDSFAALTADDQDTLIASSPVKSASSLNKDWCGGVILLDLTSRRENTYHSTQFPQPQTAPYACSWDVKVSKNCRRGKITLKIDERSRLAQDDNCSKGYFRISPFMKEAKICGEIGSVPPFRWYVDNERPEQLEEEVNIIMKNIGLKDGKSEGLSFTLSGECLASALPNPVVINKQHNKGIVVADNADSTLRWINAVKGGSLSGNGVILHMASMAFQASSKLSSKASEKISQISAESVDISKDSSSSSTSNNQNSQPIKSTTFYSPLYLLFRKLNLIH